MKLDVDTRMDARILRAGPDAELLHYRGLQLAKAQLTDGIVDASHLPFLSVGLAGGGPEAAASLVREGIWIETPNGWEIAGWAEDNLTRAQIDARRSAKQAAAEKGNHERWHVDGRTSSECRICVAGGSQLRSACEDDANRNGSPEPEGETQPEGETRLRSRPSVAPSDVVTVFEAWRAATGREKVVLDAKRRKLIADRLKAFPVEDLVAAVQGWKHSPHHRGENDRQTVYNDLELLLRDAARVEQFRDLHLRAPHLVASNGRVVPKEDAPWAS